MIATHRDRRDSLHSGRVTFRSIRRQRDSYIYWFKSCGGRGGGVDDCEDVNGVMARARLLDWKYTTRVICHIGDYPTVLASGSTYSCADSRGHGKDVPFRDIIESFKNSK